MNNALYSLSNKGIGILSIYYRHCELVQQAQAWQSLDHHDGYRHLVMTRTHRTLFKS